MNDAPAPPPTHPPTGHARTPCIIGITLLIAFSLITASVGVIAGHVRTFQLAYLVGMAGYGLVLHYVWRSSPPTTSITRWIVLAVALRLPLLAMPPSDDVSRYVWEGRIQHLGGNPYTVAPDDPKLAAHRGENFAQINHPDWTTIYPPLAQMEFALLAAVAPNPLFFKAVHVLWDVLTFILLMGWLRDRGLDPRKAIAYGLCPLTITAFSIGGHIDALMLLLMVASCLLLDRGRAKWAGVCLGLAVAAKIMALPLLLWFFRRSIPAAITAIGVILACYLPYADAGMGLFHSLIRFGAEQEFDSLLHYPLYHLLWIPLSVSKVVLLAGLLAFATWQTRRATSTADYAGPVFAAVLLALPVLHYWYLAWLLVFAPFRLRACWLVLAGAMVFYFEAQHELDRIGEWFLPVWARWATIASFAAAALAEYGTPLWRRMVIPLTRKKR